MNQPVLNEAVSSTSRAVQAGDLALRAVLSSSVIAAVCVTARGELVTANAFLLRLLRYDSLQAFRDRDFRADVLAKPKDWQHWERALATQRVSKQELTLMGADGRAIVLVGDIWAISNSNGERQLLGIFSDATAACQVDAALEHAARAEAVNGLTSGLIHDFNNLLTVLVGNLYLVAEGVRGNPTLFEQTKRARDVAKRGADLIRQLLTFSRNDREDEKALDIQRVISNLETILNHSIGSRVSLKLEIDPGVSSVEASAAQLESVIVNLAINARDAIEADGEITISARNDALDQHELKRLALTPGDYVRIAVADNGCGIPEVIQNRIFEPFFSTKETNRGTGLGLSMVRRFAEHHGGAISLESRPGVGTKISLLLPASSSVPEDSSVLTMPLKMLPTGNEEILVLANDTAIAETLEESLSILGYLPRVAASQAELDRKPPTGSFSLIIADSSFGTETDTDRLVESLRQQFSGAAVLRVGGPSLDEAQSDAAMSHLKKPFSLKDLATSVRGLLDTETHG